VNLNKMSVSIRLARAGFKKNPFYRIVVADKNSPRDGKFIEKVGTYDPNNEKNYLTLNRKRLDYWVSVGAKPTQTVAKLIKNTKEA